MEPRDELLRQAARMWTAAESIDAIKGGDAAWQWTGRQVSRLWHEGRLEEVEAVRELADVLEERLEMERGEGRREVSR